MRVREKDRERERALTKKCREMEAAVRIDPLYLLETREMRRSNGKQQGGPKECAKRGVRLGEPFQRNCQSAEV